MAIDKCFDLMHMSPARSRSLACHISQRGEGRREALLSAVEVVVFGVPHCVGTSQSYSGLVPMGSTLAIVHALHPGSPVHKWGMAAW